MEYQLYFSVADYGLLLPSFDTHACEPSPERCKALINPRQRPEYLKIVNFGVPKPVWFVTAETQVIDELESFGNGIP